MDRKMIREFDHLSKGYKALFIVIGFVILGGVMYCFYKDIVASYDGYGDLVTEYVDGGEEHVVLGWVLAILPTAIQVAFWVAMVGDLKIVTNNDMFKVVSYSCTAFDCLMDVVAYYNGTAISIVFGIILTVVVYTLFSEVIFAWLGPTLYAMISATMSETVEESSPDRVREKSGVDNMAKRAAGFARTRPPMPQQTGDRMRAVMAGNGRERQ